MIVISVLASASGSLGAQPAIGELDDAEANVCMAHHRTLNSPHSTGEGVPVEAVAGQKIEDAKRHAVQRELDTVLSQAEIQLARDARQELAKFQTHYRQLTGKNFDVGQCKGGSVRETHAMREQQARQKQHDQTMGGLAEQLAQAEQSRKDHVEVSEACTSRKVMDVPAKDAARLFPAGYVEQKRAAYEAFVANWAKTKGKPFDPAVSCP